MKSEAEQTGTLEADRDLETEGAPHWDRFCPECQRTRIDRPGGRDPYRKIYDGTPLMMHSIDRHGSLVAVNNYWLSVLGYERSDVLGRRSTDFLTEPSRRFALEVALPEFMKTGTARDVEYQMVRKTGDVVDVSLSAQSKFDEAGNLEQSFAYLLDATGGSRFAEESKASGELDPWDHERKLGNVASGPEARGDPRLPTPHVQEEVASERSSAKLVGRSVAHRRLLDQVSRVASTDATVLIQGETGTGKELLAGAIHRCSGRRDKRLVKVNCSALAPGLIESELFGHEKGAFTGSVSRKLGRFEVADGGSIFLDEIGELSLEAQAKLLRVLEEQEFERVGSSRTQRVDVRVIAATNRDLAEAVDAGVFRSDLFYRLHVFPISVTPLRERKEDIPLLVESFLAELSEKLGKSLDRVSDESMARLMNHPWPGNVRELRNVIERAAILGKGPVLDIDDSIFPRLRIGDPASHSRSLREIERAHILRVLQETGGVIAGARGAARILGLRPSTLRSRLQKLNIQIRRRAS